MENETLMSWQVVTPEPKPGNDWRLAISLGGLGLTLLALGLKNFLFALIIIIGTATLLVARRHRNPHTTYSIGSRGLVIGRQLYPYDSLESFWIHDTELGRRLSIKSDKVFVPYLILPLLPDHDLEEVRDLLLAFLEEDRHDESLVEAVTEFLVS